MADYNPYGTGGGRWPWETAKTAKLTNVPAKAPAKTTGSTSTPKPTPGLTVTNPFTGAKTTYSAADVAALKAKSDAARAEWGQKSFGIPIATPGKPAGTANVTTKGVGGFLPSNYGIGATGKPSVPTPKDSAIQKILGATGAGGAAGGAQQPAQGFTADMLYQDPSVAYQPLVDMYNQQQKQLTDRYGANAADIKNIFGNLTTVRAQDKAKIAQQFKTSIEQQQAALASRTAEARAGVAAGQQGAATAAAEMGTAGQPAPTDSLTAQAAEQGIADSNAYQTTWSALQNVMSQQAQNDVQNAVQGYDYQQTAALETLRNNLEDRLAAIQGNMAGTQSDIAQAQLAGKQNVLNAKYAESQAQQAAAAKAAAAAASAAAKSPSYSKDMFGLQQRAANSGVDFGQIQSTVRDAFDSAYALLNPAGSTKVVTPKKADILNAWNSIKAGSPQTANKLAPYVNAYVGYTYKN